MITHAIVPVSVSKYVAIVGSATFTIEPSIPSITTPRATAESRSFWRKGSVMMEDMRYSMGRGISLRFGQSRIRRTLMDSLTSRCSVR